MKNKLIISIAIFFTVACFTVVFADENTPLNRETEITAKLKEYFSKERVLKKGPASSEIRPTREITLLLREAAQNFDSYSEESQQYLSMFLMRPDSTANNWPWDGEPDFYLPAPVETPYDSPNGKFRFWYVTHNTPDGNGVVHTTTLSDVQDMATVFENVYIEIDAMGYPDPPDDSAISPNGGDSRLDIYVMNCGFYKVYGYVSSEGSGTSQPSFMVMDNDFAGFPTPPQDAMKVTAAHEYHHVVQFGINSHADTWVMEATSAWIEDQIYDDIDDNQQYLNGNKSGFFKNPDISLDSNENDYLYNIWIWLEYMETKWGQDSVKNIWLDYLIDSGSGVNAVSKVLLDEKTDFKTGFTEFTTWNYAQSELDGVTLYGDASDYNAVNIANAVSRFGYNLDYSSESSDIFTAQTLSINHLAAKYFKLTPGASITSDQSDTLTVYVKGTTGRRLDVVPIVKSSGGVYTVASLSLDSSNFGKTEITGFNRTDISEVVLVLVNYSTDQDSSSILISGGIGTDGVDNTGGAEPGSASSGSSNSGCFISTID